MGQIEKQVGLEVGASLVGALVGAFHETPF